MATATHSKSGRSRLQNTTPQNFEQEFDTRQQLANSICDVVKQAVSEESLVPEEGWALCSTVQCILLGYEFFNPRALVSNELVGIISKSITGGSSSN